jgi:hypothetical protein
VTYKDVDPVKTVTVLDVQWSNAPEDVVEDVRNLWENMRLGNDYSYVPWGPDDFHTTEDPDDEFEYEYKYPALAAYLRSRNIDECLIHFWW